MLFKKNSFKKYNLKGYNEEYSIYANLTFKMYFPMKLQNVFRKIIYFAASFIHDTRSIRNVFFYKEL